MSSDSKDRIAGGGTGRDYGAPGENYHGSIGTAEESLEERVARRVKFGRICPFCEKSFVAQKSNQRFHDPRCALLLLQGRIHEATFKRWARQLRSIIDWDEGNTTSTGIYAHTRDTRWYDFARHQLYWSIVEIRARAARSTSESKARAFELLSDSLIALWSVPELDLSAGWNDSGEINADWTQQTVCEVPGDLPRGFATLERVAAAVDALVRSAASGARIYPEIWMSEL